MFSKRIFIIITLVLLAGVAIAFIILNNGNRSENNPATAPSNPTPTPTPVTLLTWVDEAGFSFQYPEGTTIDNHLEDNKNYANLTLTLPTKEVVSIVMSDNTYKDLDEWVGDNSSIDTMLEGSPAKKIVRDGLETIASIDNEVIVLITGKDTKDIVGSWTFIYPTTTVSKNTAPSGDSGENVLEEE